MIPVSVSLKNDFFALSEYLFSKPVKYFKTPAEEPWWFSHCFGLAQAVLEGGESQQRNPGF